MSAQQHTAGELVEEQRLIVEDYLSRSPSANSSDISDLNALKAEIKAQLRAKDAVLIAHYYTDPMIQELAEETGGIVSDSLEMARFGNSHSAETLVVAGVKFMGETAKILTPHKRVLMPTLEATCSLDIGCPADQFSAFCDQYRVGKAVCQWGETKLFCCRENQQCDFDWKNTQKA